MVRLSFAVRPPDEVVTILAALPRPPIEAVAWTVPERWIVKLLPWATCQSSGTTSSSTRWPPNSTALPRSASTLGPTVRRYHGQQLSAPVTGLDEVGPRSSSRRPRYWSR